VTCNPVLSLVSVLRLLKSFFMPHFEEEGVYCFANVGRWVGLSVSSVDHMVSAHYLKNYHKVFILHIVIGYN
jgi:hypothetical protein